MAKTAAGWQVFDVVVAGISLVMTSRSAFVAEIEKSGIDGLIKALGDKNRALPAVGPASPPGSAN
jgi:phospholipid transport system substrate-binding protein